MTLVAFHSPMHEPDLWQAKLAEVMPDARFIALEEAAGIDEDSYAIVLYPPHGAMAKLPRLKAILSIAAGVDHIISDPTVPDVPIYRQTDTSLQQTMVEYSMMAVLMHHRDMPVYIDYQKHKHWEYIIPLKLAPTRHVGVLGLGNLGKEIVKKLRVFGFQVHGWSRNAKTLDGISTYHGSDGLSAMLPKCEILLNVLPLTNDTRGIVNTELLNQLPKGARFINIGRGSHVIEADLIDALDREQLSAAILDVTVNEPVLEDDPLWVHPKVVITPHVAGDILMETAIPDTFSKLKTLLAGNEPKGLFLHDVGY